MAANRRVEDAHHRAAQRTSSNPSGIPRNSASLPNVFRPPQLPPPQQHPPHPRRPHSTFEPHQLPLNPSLPKDHPVVPAPRPPGNNATRSAGNTSRTLVSTQCQTEESAMLTLANSSGGQRHCDSAVAVSVSANNASGNRALTSVTPSSPLAPAPPLDHHPVPRRRRERRERRQHHRRSQPLPPQPLQQHLQQQLQMQDPAAVTAPTGHPVLIHRTSLPSPPGQTELLLTMLNAAPTPNMNPAAGEAAAAHSPGSVSSGNERLPDILHSHIPPAYSTLPQNSERRMGLGPMPLPPPAFPGLLAPLPLLPTPSNPLEVPPGTTTTTLPGTSPMPVTAAPPSPGFYPFPHGSRRSRGSVYTGEDQGKSCCGVMVTQTVSIRWFIVMIAFVGICCAVVGTVLGAMRASGREHLTVSLLMIGVGIVLITVSGIAWRLTSQDAPSCRMMLGLGSGNGADMADTEPNRRFTGRMVPSYGRPHHPYAAMIYPEFQYRPPPPSYQASMQDYRLRLLLLDRDRQQSGNNGTSHAQASTLSPPPTYRSQASTLRPPLLFGRDQESRPPSYRSRTASTREAVQQFQQTQPRGVEATGDNLSACHSREVSRLSAISQSSNSHGVGGGQRIVEENVHEVQVVNVPSQSQESRKSPVDQKPQLTESIEPSRYHHRSASSTSASSHVTHAASARDKSKDNNTVTIVQTTDSSQVMAQDASAIVLTVPSSKMYSTNNLSNVDVTVHAIAPNLDSIQVLAQL